MLRLAFFPPIINRRNVSMISSQWLRGMEVFPTVSPPKATVEHTAQWTFRSGSSCMVQREEKQTNLYPRLSRNGIPPRVLEHRGQSFPHDPVLWFFIFSFTSNTRSKRKGSNVLRMLPSAGVTKRNAGFFSYLTSIPMLCASGLGLSGCQDLLHQNKMTSKDFGSPSSEPCFINLGISKEWKITAKFWIISTFIWICREVRKSSRWIYLLLFTFIYYPEEHLTNLNFLLCKDRIKTFIVILSDWLHP